MLVNITTRHIELTPELRNYVEKKTEKVKKYFDKVVRVKMILSEEKYLKVAELFFQAGGNNIRATEKAEDINAAIDKVIDKIAKQLKKHKEKIKEHKYKQTRVSSEENKGYSSETAGLKSALILDEKIIKPQDMSLEEAVSFIQTSDDKVHVFLNNETGKINVLCRKKKKHYELIELK